MAGKTSKEIEEAREAMRGFIREVVIDTLDELGIAKKAPTAADGVVTAKSARYTADENFV